MLATRWGSLCAVVLAVAVCVTAGGGGGAWRSVVVGGCVGVAFLLGVLAEIEYGDGLVRSLRRHGLVDREEVGGE